MKQDMSLCWSRSCCKLHASSFNAGIWEQVGLLFTCGGLAGPLGSVGTKRRACVADCGTPLSAAAAASSAVAGSSAAVAGGAAPDGTAATAAVPPAARVSGSAEAVSKRGVESEVALCMLSPLHVKRRSAAALFASRLFTAWSVQTEASVLTMYSKASADAGRSMDPVVAAADAGSRSSSSSVTERFTSHLSVVNSAIRAVQVTHHRNLAWWPHTTQCGGLLPGVPLAREPAVAPRVVKLKSLLFAVESAASVCACSCCTCGILSLSSDSEVAWNYRDLPIVCQRDVACSSDFRSPCLCLQQVQEVQEEDCHPLTASGIFPSSDMPRLGVDIARRATSCASCMSRDAQPIDIFVLPNSILNLNS